MDAGAGCPQTLSRNDRLDLKRMSREMPGEIFPTRSLDELAQRLRQRDAKPGLAPRTPDLAGVSNTLAEMSGMLSDARNEQLGISPPTSAPSRRIAAARPPVGILLYLVFIDPRRQTRGRSPPRRPHLDEMPAAARAG